MYFYFYVQDCQNKQCNKYIPTVSASSLTSSSSSSIKIIASTTTTLTVYTTGPLCDGHSQTISCQLGFIRFKSLFYGRSDTTSCFADCYDVYKSTSACQTFTNNTSCAYSSVGITSIISLFASNNWSTAVIPGSYFTLGDPCHGTYKYINISYNCV